MHWHLESHRHSFCQGGPLRPVSALSISKRDEHRPPLFDTQARLSLLLPCTCSLFCGGTAGATILITLTATNAYNQSTCLARLFISHDSQVCPKSLLIHPGTTVFRTNNRIFCFSFSTSAEYGSYICFICSGLNRF